MAEDPTKRDDWLKMLRAADLSRSLDQKEAEHRAEVKGLLLAFLEVLDSLDRLATARKGTDAAGVERLGRQLRAAFESSGVRFLETLDRPFDPECQEAVESRSLPDRPPETVVEEVRRGCTWQEELLRPAWVVVAKS